MKNTLKEELENLRFEPSGDGESRAFVSGTLTEFWDMDIEITPFQINFDLTGKIWLTALCGILASTQVKEEEGFRHTQASMTQEIQSFVRKVFNLE